MFIIASQLIKIKKSVEFYIIKRWSNMHIKLYYIQQVSEYAVSNNYNVLIKKDKH